MNDATLAAGAAIWRPAADTSKGAGDAEVLLVHRPKYDDWSLPKGKSEPDEHILLTAVREVWEETCVRPVLGPRLPTVEYISWGRPKQVSYWSSFSDGHGAVPGNEIDAVAWLPLARARDQLAGTNDDPVISALRPVETVPLILVRHASAGRKADWAGDDCLRPLDAAGVADARVLASLMACFAPVARVISSPALRCTETVRPYAERFGGTVEAEACLAPYGRTRFFTSRTEQGDALRRLLSALVADRRPAVLCLHRENVPDVLAEACAALGAPAKVPADSSLPKGGFWVAHFAPGGFGPAAAGGKASRVVPPGTSRASEGELASLERYEP
jgi:8-oxo-dGTP diphosphatase